MARQQPLWEHPGPSAEFLLKEADLALGRHDHYELETLISMVYEHFDNVLRWPSAERSGVPHEADSR